MGKSKTYFQDYKPKGTTNIAKAGQVMTAFHDEEICIKNKLKKVNSNFFLIIVAQYPNFHASTEVHKLL